MSRTLLLAAALAFGACADGTAPQRSESLRLVQLPSASAHSAEPLRRQPAVQLTDGLGAPVPRRGIVISAHIASANATLLNSTATTDSTGTARFSALSISGPAGAYSLVFHANNSGTDAASTISVEEPLCEAGKGVPLDLELGGFERFQTNDPKAPRCLEFYATHNTGQQYLVMFENIPRLGDFRSALFPAATSPASPTALVLNVAAAPATTPPSTMSAAMRSAKLMTTSVHRESAPGWNFGGNPVVEGSPASPPDGTPLTVTRYSNPHSSHSGKSALVSAIPVIGDTLQMYLAGIPRLKMADSVRTAVVRFISDDVIFAEDTRLTTTLRRANGATNTPLTVAQMDTIAREYAAYARVQGDKFFLGRFNAATEAQTRVTAVHTLMYDDNMWGYTYPNANYFAFDYWVATNGSTGGNNQVLQRVADDLFMHEISHIRHYGLLERATPTRIAKRGNQWLTEGFARFAERLPIAMRLLGTPTPSRTSNFVLARNPIFPGNAYFFDDVPTYLEAGSSVFDGYQSSSYIFDYFADQVALQGKDYFAAVRDLVVNGGADTDIDAAVSRWLPGMTFGELLTRARVALYTDDSGVAGLPPWTQYQQYQLRSSRPAGSRQAADPRNLWPKLIAGTTFAENRSLLPGAAFGYVIDGSASAVNTRIVLNATAASNGVVSITRIR